MYEQLQDQEILCFALWKLAIDTYWIDETLRRLELNVDSLVNIYKRREESKLPKQSDK
jgi:hypothetical protein